MTSKASPDVPPEFAALTVVPFVPPAALLAFATGPMLLPVAEPIQPWSETAGSSIHNAAG